MFGLKSRKPDVVCGLRKFSTTNSILSNFIGLSKIPSERNRNVSEDVKLGEATSSGEMGMSTSPIKIAICSSPKEITISITPTERLCRPRARLASDCASEDSFIVFDCGDDDTENESEPETETDLDSDVDETDFVLETPLKKVRFADKPEIYRMVTWGYAYRNARKGPWEEMARDRTRFGDRIARLESKLCPVLTEEHRNRIFEERFRAGD